MNAVAIVGYNPLTRNNAPFLNKNVDIWSLNERAMNVRRVDLAFQLHTPKDYICKGEEYINWLSTTKVPVYMREVHPEFPTSIAYPYEEAVHG
jgi:hypothetical protein